MRLPYCNYYFLLTKLAAMAVLGDCAYDVCKKCNRSYLEMREINRLHLPLARDMAYLPEEDYIEKRMQKEEQSFDRNNRNLLPVSSVSDKKK